MAGEESQEKIEEKEESNEAIDLQSIHNPSTTESKKGQMEIKSDVLDGNIVNKEGDLVKEKTEIPSKLGIFVEPNQIITEKPESLEKCTNLEGELKEEVLRHEEVPSLEEPTSKEQQEKVNGETENELYSTQFTEQISPELVLKKDGIPPNATSIISEEVQAKIDTEEVTKEDAHQNQISEKDKTEDDAIQCNSVAALSEKDYQKEVELPIENTSQHPEEDIAKEVGIPSSTIPLVAEEVLKEAKGENNLLEEDQKEQIHQIETAKKNMAEEKECPDETEDQSRAVSVVETSEETTPEEARQENQTPEMICEQVKQTEDPTLYDQPITIEKTRKCDEGSEHMPEEIEGNNVPATTILISEEAEGNDVPATMTLISKEAEESADIKEDTQEEAHQDQIFREDETDKDASQSTSVVYLPEKTIESASGNPEEVEEEEEVTKEVDLKEVDSPSVTPPVSEEVLEEANENIDALEEVQSERVNQNEAVKENWAEEKECNSAEAEVQNRDVSEVVVSEEIMPEEASSEKESPEMISEEVKPSEDTIAMDDKDETRQNVNEEHAAHKDLTSSHQTTTNEEICKTDEGSEHISEKSTLDTVTTRDITPKIEIKDAETEAPTSETDNRDIEKMENQDEAKSPEDVKSSESADVPVKIVEETLNDFEEEKLEGDNKWKHKETADKQEVKSSLATEEQFDESKAPSSEEEVSAERETIETKPIKETEGDKQNVAQNDITLDSKETFSNDEVVNYDEKAGEAMETHIAEEHNANNDIDGDKLGERNGKDDEADKGNVEEVPEPAELINNAEASMDAEIPREKIELQNDNAVSAQILEGGEALQETPCESTTLSEIERENTVYKVLDSETDNMVVVNSQEDDSNELPDKADKDASASEDQIEEVGKVNINEHDEVDHKLEVEDETEDNPAPSIQSEENPSEKYDNIKNEIIDESRDVESLTEVTEAPEEDVQNRNSTRSYKQDQLVPEKATEQDGMKISSNDYEFETEKIEIGDTPSHGEERVSIILQNDDELDLKLKPEENIEAETLSYEEISQRVEEVEEPCITHNKEELPEAQSTIECKETSNEPSISTIQQDQQSQESDAKSTEANQSTDDTSVEEGSETNTTLISSSEQLDERSIAIHEGAKMQEENIVVSAPKEETEGGSTEKQTEEIPQITNLSEVPEVDLSQSETVAPETENSEVVSDEKLGDESKSTDTDKLEELETTTNELTKLKESSIEPSNTREVQIEQTEIIAEQDQLSQESDVKLTEPEQATDEVSAQESSELDATLSASEEQIGEGPVAQVESVILQEEELKMPKEDAEMIEAANEEHTEEEILQITNPSEVPEVVSQSETVAPETENLEVVSDEKLGDESKSTDTDSKLEELENTTNELSELKENSIEPSNTREVQIDQTEIIAEQDQLSQESDVKLTEPERATDVVSAQKNSEVDTTLNASEEQIGVEGSVAQVETVILKEEELKMPKEDPEMIEAANKEHTEEEIPQVTNLSEVPEVDLSQSEIVAPETENLEVVSDEKLGDESISTDTDELEELETTTNKLMELKESSIEPSNTREVQIDQTEIIAEQDQLSEESDVKLTELERATDVVSAQKNSEVDTTLSVSEEQSGEGSVAQVETVILQEKELKMPKEDAEMIEAANEEHVEEEIPQTVHPSEITEEQLVESETVRPEAEHLGIVSNEKFGDESKLMETDLKSAQMESTPDELIEEKLNANLSSSERSELSEVLLQNTGEQVQGEKTDAEMPKEEICQAVVAAEEPCDKHIEGEILKTVDSENVAEESKSIFGKEVDHQKFETQTESPEQENAIEESASVEEKSDTTAISVPSEGQIEEKENAINESGVVSQSTSESVIVPEEKISEGVETNDEPSDKFIAGEISQIVPTSEITEKQLGESEIVGLHAEHLENVSNEKYGDESKLSEIDLTSDQMENTLDELSKEKSNANLSASMEQTSERLEESGGLLQNTSEQVQGDKTDDEIPKEEICQAIETAEEPCDKHIEGEICRTPDPEIFGAAEESKAVLTEKEVDPQKFGTEIESPEMEKVTEESVLVEEKSDATAIFVPGEGQIEEVEIANKESSGAPQSTTESVIVSEEKISQGVETNDEPSDQDISGESSKIANPEIHDMPVQSKIVSNDEEVDSEEHGTEIESTELEKATEESTSIEEKSYAGADLVPNEGKIEEIEIENKESSVSVAAQNTVELVTVPEEKVSQEIETNEEPSDKHIVGELREKDISIDNFEASEEIHLVLEDKDDQGQTAASPVEQADSKNVGTEMESAFLEKTNGDKDIIANLKKNTMTSFVEEEGSVINQTDNGSEIVSVVEQTHEEKTKLIDEKTVPEETANSTETEELQVQEEALDTVVTESENQTRDEDLIKIEPREEISEIEKVGQEKDIPTEFLKTAEQKVAVDETNEDTEGTVPNFSEQNKDVEEVPNQSEGPEDRDFASIVSSFLISKVLSEENPRTDGGAKQNNDASFIPKALDEETIPEITTNKQEPETADEEILYVTSLREEEKPEIQEHVEEHGEKKVEEDGEGDGVEQDYLPVSRFLMDKILRQEENKNPGEEKAIEGTDKQLAGDDGIQVEEKIEENSNPVTAPEQKGETPSSFAEGARDIEKEETLIQKVDDTFVGDGGISIEEKTEESSSVAALPMREGEGSRSSLEVARDFEEAKPADDAPKPVEDKNKIVVGDVGILSVEKNGEGNRSVVVVPEQEGEKSISPIEAVRDFEKEDKSIEQKNEALVTNEGISIIEKIEDNTGEVAIPKQGQKTSYPVDMVRDFDEDVKPAEIKDESLVSVDGACTLKRIEENSKVALHKEEEHKNEVIADEETLKDVRDVEENYVLVEHEVNQFEESKEILMMVSDATIPNLETKQNNLSAEIQDAERNLDGQVEITENGMKNSSVSCKEIEESLPDIPKLPMAGVKTEEILQEPLEKQRDLEATEIRKELVGNESDYTRGEEQVEEVTGTVVERIQNKNQELTEIEATKIEKKSEEIKDEEHEEEEKEEEEGKEKHQDETEIIGRDLTVKAEARETEMKSAQKKSHNILSGMGSKVKHSLAKVKKAITGKSKNVSPSAK